MLEKVAYIALFLSFLLITIKVFVHVKYLKEISKESSQNIVDVLNPFKSFLIRAMFLIAIPILGQPKNKTRYLANKLLFISYLLILIQLILIYFLNEN